MAICEADISADFIASARAVLVTGTHFSTDRAAAARINQLGWCILAVNGAANQRFMNITFLPATVIQFAINPYITY